MSSSSRSIAAARQKRAGEQSQPMNTSRPVTSISSQGAFAQQQYQQQMMSQSIPVGSKNVRLAQNKGQGQRVSSNVQQEQSTKISVSNAIGLITLRLGRLENYVSEAIEDGKFNDNNDNNDNNVINNNSIHSNMKIVSDEVFENIVNRLSLLESKMINHNNQTENFVSEMSDIKNSINNLNSALTLFINETTNKFIDYEYALSEIEKNIENNNDDVIITTEQNVDAKSAVEIDESMNNNSVNTNDLESDNKTNNDNDNETN